MISSSSRVAPSVKEDGLGTLANGEAEGRTVASSGMVRDEAWQAVALVAAGCLMGIGFLIHPDDASDPGVVGSGRWVVAHALLLAGAVPALLGLPAVRERAPGPIGLFGYLLTFSGLAVFIFVFALEALVVPVMWADGGARALLDASGPLFGGPLGVFLTLIGITTAIGLVALGTSVLRARALPSWIGIAFIVAAVTPLVPPLPYALLLVGGIGVGVAFVGSGLGVWSPSRRPTVPRRTVSSVQEA